MSLPQDFRLSSGTFDNESQIAPGSRAVVAMPVSQNSQHNDLTTVVARSDLQWMTTSSTDMRTQSPLNTSSPRPKMPPIYQSQVTSSNISLIAQRSLDDETSGAGALGHHQFAQSSYGRGTSQIVPPLQRSKKTAAASTNPPKKKGTPGRKRKFQDHEVNNLNSFFPDLFICFV